MGSNIIDHFACYAIFGSRKPTWAMDQIIERIRTELRELADEQTLQTSLKFFKEKIQPYGVRTPVVQKLAKRYFTELKDKGREEVFRLCEELWKSGYLEESFVACDWAYDLHKDYVPEDIGIFERWVKHYVGNWASCDTLCNHAVGSFIEMYPQHISRLKAWAQSENRWVRRAAAVTLIIPARKGLFLQDVLEIADILLMDRDDLVRKGYGWMLKAASEAHRQEVFEYVLSKKSVMPRTSLRYAIEKMPPELREKAMEK